MAEPKPFDAITAFFQAYLDALTALTEAEPTQADYALCRGGEE